jgi:hypothetical protein
MSGHCTMTMLVYFFSTVGVVVKGVTELVEFITDLEMKLLDCNTLRPGPVANLSHVAGKTAAQCR